MIRSNENPKRGGDFIVEWAVSVVAPVLRICFSIFLLFLIFGALSVVLGEVMRFGLIMTSRHTYSRVKASADGSG